MSTPQSNVIRMADIDERFELPTEPTKADTLRYTLANATKEGRRRERVLSEARVAELTNAHAAYLQGVSEAHLGEVARIKQETINRETSVHMVRAARATSFAFGGVIGAGLAAALTYGAMSSGMFSIVAADRARAQPVYAPPTELTVHAPVVEEFDAGPQPARPHPPANAP